MQQKSRMQVRSVVQPDWTRFSLREQIGQMIVVRASGYLFDHQIRYPSWEASAAKLRRWLQELNLGGVILLGGSAGELYLRTQQLQAWAKTPLLVAADIEEGVGQRFTGATQFPPPMAIGAIASQNPSLARQYATQMGAITAQEAVAVGINWILAPVVDVNNNPDNPVINVRAFGDTPQTVSDLATAFIEGASQYPVLTTAKHFPGHGDTAGDSHLNLPTLTHTAARLETVELPPFERAIAAGVDSVMSAHLLIREWDSERPATLSKSILTGQLRHKLGFEGLIVTDALIMGGVAQSASAAEIAVMAVEAGADILLMPEDPEIAIAAIYDAVLSGRITKERIETSVARIYRAKQKVLSSSSSPPVPQFPSQLSQTAATTLAETVLRESMQSGGTSLQSLPQQGQNLIVVDDALNCPFLGRHTPAATLPKQLGFQVQLVDQSLLNYQPSRPTLLQVFIRGNPFRGTAGLLPGTQAWLKDLLATDAIALLVYGSPYVLEWFKEQIDSRLPWVYSFGQMPAAQALACQVLFGMSVFDDMKNEAFL